MPIYELTNPKSYERSIIVGCACHIEEHQLRLLHLGDEEMFITFHLTRHGFFRRVWTAIRYVCGYRCRYGEWDEVVLGEEEAQGIIEFLTRYVEGVQHEST